MKVTVNENKDLQLEEVYNSIVLKASSKETLSICMRDGGFEIVYQNKFCCFKDGFVGVVKLPEKDKKDGTSENILS